jgi:cytosine/creatinine deaminase
MDLIIRNARCAATGTVTTDIGIADGRIVAIAPGITAEARVIDTGGRWVSPGFVETHLHLDKSCIMDRCKAERGDLAEAIAEVSAAKKAFTVEDVYARGKRTLERCILQGTTHIRTQLEIDPVIRHIGFEAIKQLAADYKWAVDIEICAFPQEGLLNNPGTDELLVAAMRSGAHVIGACPYVDTDPNGQIDRIFDIAREFGSDIDMHLDFSLRTDSLDLDYVCAMTDKRKWGGRVTVGHVSKLSAVAPDVFASYARRMADTGVALIALPSTDLYLMGREHTHNIPRGLARAHVLLGHGVNCALSTNNVLNPFTPFGDCSLLRQANLYANAAQAGRTSDLRDCLDMITTRAARLMNLKGYGLQVGNAADLVILDCENAAQAVAELAPVLFAIKRGRVTVTRDAPVLHRPA